MPAPVPPQGPQPGDPIIFTKFDGLKNTSNAERLTPRDLVRARNIDLDDTGQAMRRRGKTLLVPGEAHSLFTALDGSIIGVVDGVLGLVGRNGSFLAMRSGIGVSPYAGTGQLSYAQVGDTIFYTSPTDSGKIDVRSWSVSDWGVAHALWLSPVVNPTTTLAAIKGRLLRRPPNGTALAYYNGRIYIVVDNVVWFTELYLYDYVDATRNFYPFSGSVGIIGSVGDGLYVGDEDGVWFLQHAKDMKPEQAYNMMKRMPVMDSPPIPGSLVYIPTELGNPSQVSLDADTPVQVSVAFMTQNGFCVGQAGGQAYNLTENKFFFPQAQRAAALFRRQDGNNQYVVTMQHGGTPANNASIGDYLDATIIRATDAGATSVFPSPTGGDNVPGPPGPAGPAGPIGPAGPAGPAGDVSSLAATAVTANGALGSALPAGAFILYALFRETAGRAVSVGIGTSAGATDVLAPQAIEAGRGLMAPIQAFATDWFSAGSTQQLYLTSSNWNSASVNATLVYIPGP